MPAHVVLTAARQNTPQLDAPMSFWLDDEVWLHTLQLLLSWGLNTADSTLRLTVLGAIRRSAAGKVEKAGRGLVR